MRVVIMSNVFDTELSLTDKYDLKGSLYKRYTDVDKNGKAIKGAILKDLNFHDNGNREIQLHPEMYSKFVKALRDDTKLLAKFGLMDYSEIE
jgi:1-phosphatidylinositol-4-phosphate 5-kinase